MTPVRSIKNQYWGINAHLHSAWQSEGGWDSFHTNHIADLMRLMSAQLLPMGYIADIQQSLQIRRYGEPAGRPESDVTIYDPIPARAAQAYSRAASSAPVLDISDIMTGQPEMAEYQALGIYTYTSDRSGRGDPVAWVELLSPSNKPGGQDAIYYRDKRWKLLNSGIVFVEIDYLHESPPTFDRVPAYNPRNNEAHPYHIFVVDPRPTFAKGKAYPHHFDVDMPIPKVDIPLNAGEALSFNFSAAYHKTFEETLYGAAYVDYRQLPAHFDRYQRKDQVRILARMQSVVKAAQVGVDLEQNAPLPAIEIDYDKALSEILKWQKSG